MTRRWQETEIDYLRRHYGKRPAKEIASELGRPLHQVYGAADRYGLSEPQRGLPDEFHSILRLFHERGWSDAEIAEFWQLQGWPFDRRSICDHRRALGLPSNALSERRRRRVAAKTREQCRQAGLRSLAEVRCQAFERFARARGWPADLPPRCVQMLDVMYERGPMTRRQLAAAIGMPWKGSKKTMVGSVPGGTYLAFLMRRGLVVKFRKVVKQPGSGRNVDLYQLPLHVKRGVPHGQTEKCAGT